MRPGREGSPRSCFLLRRGPHRSGGAAPSGRLDPRAAKRRVPGDEAGGEPGSEAFHDATGAGRHDDDARRSRKEGLLDPCVTSTTPAPEDPRPKAAAPASARASAASSAPRGSSIRRNRGSVRAPARGRRAASSPRTVPRSACRRRRRGAPATGPRSPAPGVPGDVAPRIRSAKATFSATVSQGKSASSWKTIARSRPVRRWPVPSMVTVPSGRLDETGPAATERSVVFPHPDRPVSTTNSPRGTDRLTRRRRVPPAPSYVTVIASSARVDTCRSPFSEVSPPAAPQGGAFRANRRQRAWEVRELSWTQRPPSRTVRNT